MDTVLQSYCQVVCSFRAGCMSGGTLKQLVMKQMGIQTHLYSDADAFRWALQIAEGGAVEVTRRRPGRAGCSASHL